MLPIQEVYNKISDRFDVSRVRIWGSVRRFLDPLPLNSFLLDIGCGNGKNILYRKDLQFEGIDLSEKLVNICKNKNLKVQLGNMINLPYENKKFDNAICIASYHHLDNDNDRKKALSEMYRVLKKDGRVLITVWAMEQDNDSHVSFKKKDEMVPWKSNEDGNIYYRYYHIYAKGDLEEEIKRLCPEFTIQHIEFELGNWSIMLCMEKKNLL
jgi:SAM-dependent methyltransferase